MRGSNESDIEVNYPCHEGGEHTDLGRYEHSGPNYLAQLSKSYPEVRRGTRIRGLD